MFFFNFSTTCIWNISNSKEKWAGNAQKSTFAVMYITRYSCQNLVRIELFFLDKFAKNTQI